MATAAVVVAVPLTYAAAGQAGPWASGSGPADAPSLISPLPSGRATAEPSTADPENGRPVPSGSPLETPTDPAEVPAFLVPVSAGLSRAEVPQPLILWEDTGPRWVFHAFPGLDCEGDMPDGRTESLGGRTWQWEDPTSDGWSFRIMHAVSVWPRGTGRAHFSELVRTSGSCMGVDTDVVTTMEGLPGEEGWLLVADQPHRAQDMRFVRALSRSGDVLVAIEVVYIGSRDEAVALARQVLERALSRVEPFATPRP